MFRSLVRSGELRSQLITLFVVGIAGAGNFGSLHRVTGCRLTGVPRVRRILGTGKVRRRTRDLEILTTLFRIVSISNILASEVAARRGEGTRGRERGQAGGRLVPLVSGVIRDVRRPVSITLNTSLFVSSCPSVREPRSSLRGLFGREQSVLNCPTLSEKQPTHGGSVWVVFSQTSFSFFQL